MIPFPPIYSKVIKAPVYGSPIPDYISREGYIARLTYPQRLCSLYGGLWASRVTLRCLPASIQSEEGWFPLLSFSEWMKLCWWFRSLKQKNENEPSRTMKNTSTYANSMEFSIKSKALHMKIFPNTSFGNSHALIDSNLLKIWRLLMLAHIHLKSEIYPKASFGYFSLFQMWSMHLQSEFARSFEESYNCIHESNLLNITKGKFWLFI